jgi:hypothetical protein
MWDFYPYTGNNFYLFNNSETGKFEWIPWDLAWGEGEYKNSLFKFEGFGLSQYRPMTENVFAVNKYKKKYAAYVDLLVRHYFNNQHLNKEISKFHKMIAPFITKSTGDKGFSENSPHFLIFPPEEFKNSMWNLIQFVNNRSQFIKTELQNFNVQTAFTNNQITNEEIINP